MRDLYAPAADTPPEWAAIARQVAAGIDAGWTSEQWLSLRTEFPDESWSLPQRAVTYLLTSLRGAGFLKRDALRDFLLHTEQYDIGLDWMADTLLVQLSHAPVQ